MISVIEGFLGIISSYEILKFHEFEGRLQFIAVMVFRDDSKLYAREYIFANGERKYSYHWQDVDENMIYRWDNSDHHKHLKTYPFHQHSVDGVEESVPMTLRKVLEIIERKISKVQK